MSSATTTSFSSCLSACDAATGSVAVAYVSGACYLKNQINTPVANAGVWGAKRNDASATTVSCVNNLSNGQQYTASSGAVFDIICGVDYYGGDLKMLDTATFTSCIEACAANTQCVDITYVGTSYHLKNVLQSPVTGSVWTAKLHAGNPISSSTTSTVSTTKTTASTTTPTSTTTSTTSQTPTSTPTTSTDAFSSDNFGLWSFGADPSNSNKGGLAGTFGTGTLAYMGSSYA